MAYKVYLQKIPFEEILRSVYETLKLECQGVLFGEMQEKRSGLNWIVESAHPIQLVERFPTRTEPFPGSSRAYLEFGSEAIGDYHSHPTRGKDIGKVRLGKTRDTVNLKEKSPKIEIIVAIKPVKITRRINENPFNISGYIFEDYQPYKINIGAYFYNDRIRKAEITAPKRILKLIQ